MHTTNKMDSIFELFNDLKELAENKKLVNANELLAILKRESLKVTIKDIMDMSVLLREDSKYVQDNYREHYLESYIKGFLLRTKEIKENKNSYKEEVSTTEFLEAIEMLKAPLYDDKTNNEELYKQAGGKCFQVVYIIISLYTTFILNEPIHLVGTTFPGGSAVRFDSNNYYCPVRDAQSKSPNAVCGFCIAKQDENI